MSKDLKTVEKHLNLDLGKEKGKANQHNQHNQVSNGAGDLFSSLIASAEKDEKQYDDLERKRQRNKEQSINTHYKLKKRKIDELELKNRLTMLTP